MNPTLSIPILTFALLLLSLTASSQLSISTNQSIPYYKAGESMEFIIESADESVIEYWISYGQFSDTIQSGVIENHQAGQASTISFTLNEPGFVFCHVEQNFEKELTAAAFSPNDIKIQDSKPSDFSQFWNDQIASSNNIPLDPEISYEEEDSYTTTYRISLAHIDNRRIYGFISIPKSTGPYPASIILPPFGSSANIVQADNFTAERAGMIAVSMSIHNAPPGVEDPNAYEPDDITDRENIYYKYAVLGAIRMIDYLHTRDDFDQENICLMGSSQGGGLSLLVAGIDDRVNLLIQSIAALCGHSEFKYGKATGFPYYLNLSDVTTGTAQHLNQTDEASSYYDAVHSVVTAKVSSLNFVSYQDLTCPPATGYAAFNNLPGPKIMGHSIFEDHSSPQEFTNDRYQFFRRHYEATLNPPFPYSDSNLGYFIDAGPAAEIPESETLQLAGLAERDGVLGSNWQIAWDVVEGPAEVNFSDITILNPTVSFNVKGDYKLRLIVTDPYQEDEELFFQLVDYVNIVVTDGLSFINHSINQFQFSVFPNPSSSIVHIEFPSQHFQNFEIRLISNNGSEAFYKKIINNYSPISIPVGHLSKGQYNLEILSEKGISTKSIVLQ